MNVKVVYIERDLASYFGANLGLILYPLRSKNWSLDRMVAIV